MSVLEISPLEDGGGFKLSGELDLATAHQLQEALLLDGHRRGELRLDMSELTFIDSSGVGAILTHARSRNGHGPIVLVRPTATVSRPLQVMSLDQHPGIVVEPNRD